MKYMLLMQGTQGDMKTFGTMSPEECRAVAPRLRELIAPWPADDYDRQHGALLSDMMEFCAESNTDLLFC